jgi:hypothetical protein
VALWFSCSLADISRTKSKYETLVPTKHLVPLLLQTPQNDSILPVPDYLRPLTIGHEIAAETGRRSI